MDVIEQALWCDSDIQASLDDVLLPQWGDNLSWLNDLELSPLQEDTTTGRGSSSPTAKLASVSRPRRRATGSSSTFSRRRDEIGRLRVAAEYLELHLNQLHEEATLGNERKLALSCPVAVSKSRHERQQAERENQKLRELLQDQIVVRDQLEAFVTLCRTQKHESQNWWPQPPLPPRFTCRHDCGLLDALIIVLDAMHAQTDSMLCDPRLKPMATTPSMSHAEAEYQRDPHCLVAKRIGSRMVPFDVSSTATALWSTLADQAQVLSTDWCSDTVRSQFVMYASVPGLKGHVQANMTFRRIHEPSGRVVMLRSSMFTYLSPPCHGRPSGGLTSARHLSWLTINPLGQFPGCQLQICDLIVPHLDGEADGAVPAMAKFYVAMTHHLEEDLHNLVDDALLRL